MHHDSHILSANGYCETCGQPLPLPGDSYALWEEKKSITRRYGLAFTIALHLAFVLYYLFAPSPPPPKPTSAPKGGQMVYIAPLPITPQKPTVKPTPKKAETKPTKTPPPPRKAVATPSKPTVNTPKLETFVPPVQATMTPPPPEQDMSEMLAKRRAQRESANPPSPPTPPAESAAERSMARAKANIAGANARGGESTDDKGGLYSIEKRSNSADIKFRIWNANFKRDWLQQIHVEQGAEKDIETAVIKEMIRLIRKNWPEDVNYESRRLGRTVKLSTRKEDEKELAAFLMKESFPDYRP